MLNISFDWIGVAVIVFRESLEAGLVSLIILTYLARINRRDLDKYVYSGAGLAIFLSVVLGSLISFVYSELSDVGADFFEVIAGFIAVPVLTFMIIWMARNAKKVRDKLEGQLQVFISRNYLIGIMILSLTTVAREGLETVLFLITFIGSSAFSTMVGSVIGILFALGFLWVINKGFTRIKLQFIFKYTSLLIIVLAAGILFKTVNEMVNLLADNGISLGVLGHLAYYLDIPEGSILSDKGLIGGIFSAFTGYMVYSTWIGIIVYIIYWTVASILFYKTYVR
ncbi:MAG: FTR1 family protein [Thermoprotei archaeon]